MRHYFLLIILLLEVVQILSFLSSATTNTFSSPTNILFATWSNGQAVREYKDFLSGNTKSQVCEDIPSLIIGNDKNSPLVNALKCLAKGKEDILISDAEPIPNEIDGRDNFPIYVALTPKELQKALKENLASKWMAKIDDFVFITWKNTNLEPLLKQYSLPRDSTSQLLPSFTLPDQPFIPQDMAVKYDVDSYGEAKWSTQSVSCGKWKEAIASRLQQNSIHCEPKFYRDYRRGMWEKFVMEAVFNLIGAVLKEPTTYEDVANYYANEASDMVWQISTMLRGSLAITLTYGFEERIFTFAEQRGKSILCEIDESTFDFCNGVIWEISKSGLNLGFGDPAPLHTEYLIYAKEERGLLQSLDIPEEMKNNQDNNRVSIMRQGNLRADGVV